MARKASNPQPHVEPEDETQEMPEPNEPRGQAEASDSPVGASISKTEAAHKAMDAGHDKPLDAVEYIRKTFGIELSPQHFSSIKSNRKKLSGQEPGRRGPGRKAAETAGAPKASAPKEHTQRASADDTDLLDDMASVKNLVQKLGADKVRKIVDLFE